MCAAYSNTQLSKPNIPFEHCRLSHSSINLMEVRPTTPHSTPPLFNFKRVLKVGKKRFEFGEEIARTKLATVFRGVELRLMKEESLVRTARYVAIKVVRKDSLSYKTQENILSEISSLKELLSLNEKLSNYVESCQDLEHYYLITRLCEGGDLFSHVNDGHIAPFDEQKTKRIFRKLVESFRELHEHGWAHRDASSENILYNPLNNDEVLLIDYGMAIKHAPRPSNDINADDGNKINNDTDNRCNVSLINVSRDLSLNHDSKPRIKKSYHKIANSGRSGCGKVFYRSPESFLVPMPDLDFRCDDIWSLGVILFLLLTSTLPMKSATVSDDSYCIIAQEKRLSDLLAHWRFPLSVEVVDLMQSILVTNPEERPTADDILNHPWLSSSAASLSSPSSPTASNISTEGA